MCGEWEKVGEWKSGRVREWESEEVVQQSSRRNKKVEAHEHTPVQIVGWAGIAR